MVRLVVGLVLALSFIVPLDRGAAATAPPAQIIVEPDAGITPFLSFVAEARSSLDGEAYLVSSTRVLIALEQAEGRGVHVRLLLEPSPGGVDPTQPRRIFNELQAHGVAVRWANPAFRYTQAAFLIADRRSVFIGTMNWTDRAFTASREFGVIDRTPAVAQAAGSIFSADWSRTTVRHSVAALVVGPINARAALTAFIGRAVHSLDIYSEQLADSAIDDALIAAVRRGVRVRLVLAQGGHAPALSQAGALVVVRRYPYMHAGAIVVDRAAVYIGSGSFSSTSLDYSRDVGLILSDPTAIAPVEAAFEADVQGSYLPPSAVAPRRPGAVLFVRMGVSPNPTAVGLLTTIQAVTLSGAHCIAAVRYASGRKDQTAALTLTQTANALGSVSWSWRPPKTKRGPAIAKVRCTLGSQSVLTAVGFTVR